VAAERSVSVNRQSLRRFDVSILPSYLLGGVLASPRHLPRVATRYRTMSPVTFPAQGASAKYNSTAGDQDNFQSGIERYGTRSRDANRRRLREFHREIAEPARSLEKQRNTPTSFSPNHPEEYRRSCDTAEADSITIDHASVRKGESQKREKSFGQYDQASNLCPPVHRRA